MNIEDIILTKSYFELTPQDKNKIETLVSSEDEFNEMKAFFVQTKSHFQNQKIKTSTQLNQNVLNYLHQSPAKKTTTWYNSLILFLFPRDKNIFQYPAFHLAIATVLVFGLFGLFNNTSQFNSDSIAAIKNKTEKQNTQNNLHKSDINPNKTSNTITNQNIKNNQETTLPNQKINQLNTIETEPTFIEKKQLIEVLEEDSEEEPFVEEEVMFNDVANNIIKNEDTKIQTAPFDNKNIASNNKMLKDNKSKKTRNKPSTIPEPQPVESSSAKMSEFKKENIKTTFNLKQIKELQSLFFTVK